MREASGGYNNATAYGLIYINQRLSNQLNSIGLMDYSNKFSSLVSANQIARMKLENGRFSEEVTGYQCKKISTKIIATYNKRLEEVSNLIASKNYYKDASNLAVALKLKKLAHESQWMVLNQTIAELHPAGIGIKELQRDDPIFVQICQGMPKANFLLNEV